MPLGISSTQTFEMALIAGASQGWNAIRKKMKDIQKSVRFKD